MTQDELKAIKWLLTGDVGDSSKAMLAAVMGIDIKNKKHPLDPSDFKRCLDMVDAVPIVKYFFVNVAELSDVWEKIIENWYELERLYNEEKSTGNCSKLYKRMKELGC